MPNAEQLTDPVATHGEGPVWSPCWGGLRWVDMLVGDVLALAADGAITREHVGTVAAALRPRRAGGYVVALERGFAMADAAGAAPRPLSEIWDDPMVRMNDGGCDPDGRFYCGTMAYTASPGAGALYRLAVDGVVTRVLTGVTISNGLDWSPDGTRAYYVDTPTQRIDVFDYDPTAGLTARRPFVSIAPLRGAPDGLTVDTEGGIWVALWGGGAVHRYLPDGTLDDVVSVPGASQVTACTFGGPQLDELFITTSRLGLEPGAEPLGGSVFHHRPGIAGLPVRPYAG